MQEPIIMHETGQPEPTLDARKETLMVYIAVAAGLVTGGVGTIIGLIYAYVRRNDIQGSIYHSHLNYLIKTIWITFGLSVLGFLTTVILIGFVIMFAAFVWYVYRVIYGFVKWNDHQSVVA
ncbi:MAG: hypothetical protein KBC57_11075 [Neisseriaceae bacterium]|nr:hypothetical protein [Neisseriaceae bacterium]MBP6862882.1 hypothetical protein [Neisseriaceae bacterium]